MSLDEGLVDQRAEGPAGRCRTGREAVLEQQRARRAARADLDPEVASGADSRDTELCIDRRRDCDLEEQIELLAGQNLPGLLPEQWAHRDDLT